LAGCATPKGDVAAPKPEPPAAVVTPAQKQVQALFVDGADAAAWKRVRGPDFYGAGRIFDYIDGYGEIPLSYNLEVCGTAQYADEKSGGKAKLDIYCLKTSPDAFGFYSFERSPDAEFLLDLGPQGWFKQGKVAFWKGTYYVRLAALADTDKDRLVALAQAVANRITVLSALPKDMHYILSGATHSYVENTLKFFHQKVALDAIHFQDKENVLDLGADTNGFVAQCAYKEQRWKLFLIQYPSAVKAGQAYERYRQHLSEAGYQMRAAQTGAPSFVATKPDAKSVAALAQGKYVGGVWDATTERFAEMPMKMLLKALPKPEDEERQPDGEKGRDRSAPTGKGAGVGEE
jgi:hypothetical protein